ncbi:unnamed protein product [Closterium sp. NIES-65]|nr:unnamed protein product [Closterium sp. NIES-65]
MRTHACESTRARSRHLVCHSRINTVVFVTPYSSLTPASAFPLQHPFCRIPFAPSPFPHPPWRILPTAFPPAAFPLPQPLFRIPPQPSLFRNPHSAFPLPRYPFRNFPSPFPCHLPLVAFPYRIPPFAFPLPHSTCRIPPCRLPPSANPLSASPLPYPPFCIPPAAFPVPHSPCRIPHSAFPAAISLQHSPCPFHIPPSAIPLPHSLSRIPHSATPLPHSSAASPLPAKYSLLPASPSLPCAPCLMLTHSCSLPHTHSLMLPTSYSLLILTGARQTALPLLLPSPTPTSLSSLFCFPPGARRHSQKPISRHCLEYQATELSPPYSSTRKSSTSYLASPHSIHSLPLS